MGASLPGPELERKARCRCRTSWRVGDVRSRDADSYVGFCSSQSASPCLREKKEINKTMNVYRSLEIFFKKYRTNERT